MPILFFVLNFYSVDILAQNWIEYNNAGVNYSNQGEFKLSIQKFKEAKVLYSNTYGNDTFHKDYATLLYSTGVAYFGNDNYDSALLFFQISFDIRGKLYDENTPEYEQILNYIGAVNYRLKNYKCSLEFFLKDFNICEKIFGAESKGYVIAICNLGNLYNKMKIYDKAEELLIKGLSLKAKIYGKDDPSYSLTLTALAELYIEIREYEKAEPLSIEAAKIRKKISGVEHPYYLQDIIRLAQIYKNMASYEKSQKLYLEALELKEKGIQNPDYSYISILNELGNICIIDAKYKEAEKYLLKSMDANEALNFKDQIFYGNTLNELGALYISLSDFNKAEIILKKAIKIREENRELRPLDYAASLNNLGECYRNIGNVEEAINLYKISAEIHFKIQDTVSIGYAATLNNLAIAYSMKSDYREALSLMLKSSEMTKGKPDDIFSFSRNLRNIGTLYLYIDDFENAEKYLLSSKSLMMKVGKTNQEDYILVLGSIAYMYEKQNRHSKAIKYEIECLQLQNILLETYSRFLLTNQMEQYLVEIADFYKTFRNYTCTYSSKYPTLCNQAFNNEILLKCFMLNNSLQIKNALRCNNDSLLKSTFNKRELLSDTLGKLYTQRGVPDSSIDAFKIKIEKLEKILVNNSEIFRQFNQHIKTDWKQVKNALKNDELVVNIIKVNYAKEGKDSIIYGALLLRSGYKHPKYITLFEQKQFDSVFSYSINDYSRVYNINKMLYDLIIKPIEAYQKNINKIYFSVSGLLNNINLSAILIDSNTIFGEKYHIHILNSSADIVTFQPTYLDIKSIKKAIVYGGVDYNKTTNTPVNSEPINDNIGVPKVAEIASRSTILKFNYLPGTEKEAKSIQHLCSTYNMPSISFIGENATEESFKQLSGKQELYILHIATHGYFFPDPEQKTEKQFQKSIETETKNVFKWSDNPLLRSGLIFAGANHAWSNPGHVSESTEDGILTSYEISNLDLSSCQLVVLSACETGLGDIKGSEGVFGLQRAFKMAGVKNIIMSLWKIPDAQTSELMTSFYTYCFVGKSVHDALQAAQSDMRKKYPPYYWAGFKLLE